MRGNFEGHELEAETRVLNGEKFLYFSCQLCDFVRIDQATWQSSQIGGRVWREQHLDYVTNPSSKVNSFQNNSGNPQLSIEWSKVEKLLESEGGFKSLLEIIDPSFTDSEKKPKLPD